jgi:hypothetical protein
MEAGKRLAVVFVCASLLLLAVLQANSDEHVALLGFGASDHTNAYYAADDAMMGRILHKISAIRRQISHAWVHAPSRDEDPRYAPVIAEDIESLDTIIDRARTLQNNLVDQVAELHKKVGRAGVRGPPGAVGLPGRPGPAGKDGTPGHRGAVGARGIRGLKGARGKAGLAGIPGRPGLPGKRGPTGHDGEEGQQGLRGDSGEDGRRGARGEDGEDGEDGVKGRDGRKGRRGTPGFPGRDGTRAHVWGGTSKRGDTCHFPFVHKSVSYNTCITDGKDGPWCYASADSSRWGFCELAVPVTGGNSPAGSVCHFPGTYRGQKFFNCFEEGQDRPWCYTNEEQTQWGDCAMEVEGGQSKADDTCFTRCSGSYHSQPWCWLDDQNTRWGHCLFNVVYRSSRRITSDANDIKSDDQSDTSDKSALPILHRLELQRKRQR